LSIHARGHLRHISGTMAADEADLAVQACLSHKEHEGWIDVDVCEALISKPLNFVCGIDGSDAAIAGFKAVTEGMTMQNNRESFLEVVHVFDDSKTYLPPAWQPDALRAVVEAQLSSSVSQKRYRIHWARKDGMTAAQHLNARCKAINADFCVMGFVGRKAKKGSTEEKAKKDRGLIASNVAEALQTISSTCIVFKDESPELLPLKRPAKFVVSVSLNQASTKAFLDALRLSNPGDEIHVVYVKSFMERTESDYTHELREKYSGFFSGLQQDSSSQAFSKFHDRKTEFVMISKQRRETTAQAVVRYGDDIEADYMVVGTNTLRVQKGKHAIGSVSLDICMEWERNFIVSHWMDLRSDIYDKHVKSPSK